jgi:hypothetical protein
MDSEEFNSPPGKRIKVVDYTCCVKSIDNLKLDSKRAHSGFLWNCNACCVQKEDDTFTYTHDIPSNPIITEMIKKLKIEICEMVEMVSKTLNLLYV